MEFANSCDISEHDGSIMSTMPITVRLLIALVVNSLLKAMVLMGFLGRTAFW